MSKELPDKIEVASEDWEGYHYEKRDDVIIKELVESFNQMIDVVADLKEQLNI